MTTAYYLGLSRGFDNNPDNVVAGTATNGTSSDIDLRIQTVNGATSTGITKADAVYAMVVLTEFINGNGAGGNGANLPAS